MVFSFLVFYFVVRSRTEFLGRIENEVYYKYFYFWTNLSDIWMRDQFFSCDGKFHGYGNEFARLYDVAVNVQQPGHFFQDCSRNYPVYEFNDNFQKNHLNNWVKSITQMNTNINRLRRPNTTFAVLRYEYANLFHQITDIYNVYVVTKLLKLDPSHVNILFFGRHNTGHIDKCWDTLFGDVERIEEFNQPVLYKDLIWAVLGYNSPINYFSLLSLPFVDEFSDFVVKQHNSIKKKLNCDSISVLFIWREDYIAHPNNPSGLISRKIKNSQNILQAVENAFPGYNVGGIQLDQYQMADQIKWISQTDILVGMHGAGMTHTLFLPAHAGVLELYPNYWPKTNRHFNAMAKWRKLHYLNWQNINPTNEKERFYTYIPATIVVQRIRTLFHKMCS